MIVKSKNEAEDLEKRIISLLKEGNIIPAANLYSQETHEKDLAKTYEYINKVAARNGIDLKKVDKGGCATSVVIFVIITASISLITLL